MLFNLLIATLKRQSNGPLYSNTVIVTLAVDGWAVTFGTARRGLGRGRSPPRPLLAVPNVTAHPSAASVPTSASVALPMALYKYVYDYDYYSYYSFKQLPLESKGLSCTSEH